MAQNKKIINDSSFNSNSQLSPDETMEIKANQFYFQRDRFKHDNNLK